MTDWFEWAIIAVIMLGIGVTIWRGGSANPVSTRVLEQRVGALTSEVGKLKGKVGQVEGDLSELKGEAATTSDITSLRELVEEKIRTVEAKMEGHAEVSAATNRGVERIERILLQKALDK